MEGRLHTCTSMLRPVMGPRAVIASHASCVTSLARHAPSGSGRRSRRRRLSRAWRSRSRPGTSSEM
eukprot:4016068-Heterocapsa_arctica.AAC.1